MFFKLNIFHYPLPLIDYLSYLLQVELYQFICINKRASSFFGEVFGLDCIVKNKPSTVSVESMLKDTIYLEMDIICLKNMMEKHDILFENILEILINEKDKLKRMIVVLN